MNQKFLAAGVCLGLTLAAPMLAHAQQTRKNPEISAIGDTRLNWDDVSDRATFELSEVELALVGPLNPYASGEVFLSIHGEGPLEIEEAKLLLERYLPAGLGLTMGKMYQDFGRINTFHSHAYPFVFRPQMHVEFFGDDGIRDVGARLDWIAPIDAFTLTATLGAVRGDLFLDQAHGHEEEQGEHEEAQEEAQTPRIGVTGRVDAFTELNDDLSMLLGVSVMHGEHDTHERAKATWVGVDLKGELLFGSQSKLVLAAESNFGSLDETLLTEASSPWGWFASADVRANPRWNFGGFAESTEEKFEDQHSTSRFGGFVGLSLMEETTVFRLVAHRTEPFEGKTETGITLQALFGLGPHRPHRY